MPNQNNNPSEKKEFKLGGDHNESNFSNQESEKGIFVERNFELTEKSSAEKDSSYQNILSKIKTTKPNDDDDDSIQDEADYLFQKKSRDEQVETLVKLAFVKGVVHAVKVAQKMDDYYVLDQLHDKLVQDDLRKALISSGLISED